MMSHALPMLLRAMPIAISGSAHAALIAALIVASPIRQEAEGAQVVVLEVSMVDDGEAKASAGSASPLSAEAVPEAPAEQAAIAAPPAPEPSAAPEAVEAEATSEPPAPEAVVTPLPVTPAPKPKVERRPKTPVMAERPRAKAPPRKASPKREGPARERGVSAGPRREGAQVGSGAGRNASPGGGLSGAAYAGKVRAILQARANALGIEDQEGAVGLSFVIGSSGRMESHAITRTSGSASVDRMIRGMMASSSFPPPPGGRFAGSVTIRIH